MFVGSGWAKFALLNPGRPLGLIPVEPSGMDAKEYKPMTRQGYLRLAKEYNHLLNVERPKVVQGVATAAADGDRSENAEYIYGKKRLREIDKRLRYLDGLLKDVQVVNQVDAESGRVFFGAVVEVRYPDGQKASYQLVGVGETEDHTHQISWQSPVGRSLMGKRIGDIVAVQRPQGDIDLEIIGIRQEED